MNDKLRERVPKSSEIMNAIKTGINIVHSLCDESNAVLFRKDLATLMFKWFERLENGKDGTPIKDVHGHTGE